MNSRYTYGRPARYEEIVVGAVFADVTSGVRKELTAMEVNEYGVRMGSWLVLDGPLAGQTYSTPTSGLLDDRENEVYTSTVLADR